MQIFCIVVEKALPVKNQAPPKPVKVNQSEKQSTLAGYINIPKSSSVQPPIKKGEQKSLKDSSTEQQQKRTNIDDDVSGADFMLFPGEFDVLLCIDNHEHFGGYVILSIIIDIDL